MNDVFNYKSNDELLDKSRDKFLLGIDGGGTKTAISIAKLDSQGEITVLGSAVNGASNIASVGRECAFQNLNAALDAAYDDAQIPPENIDNKMDYKIDCAVLGLAGLSSLDVRPLVNDWINTRRLAKRVALVSDIDPVMMAGTSDNWGIALIVGTGSIAKGINRQGETLTLGGFGHWYGDQGSAYDLGRQALIASVKFFDGIGPETGLQAEIFKRLNVSKADDIIAVLEGQGDVRGQIAALANIVPTLAEQGDPVAIDILGEAIDYILALCTVLAKRLNLPADFSMALAGGVICCNEVYRTAFKTALQNTEIRGARLTLVTRPVEGCLAIAKKTLLDGD